MQELFRFYAVRSPELVAASAAVDLTTTSAFQASLGKPGANPATVLATAVRAVATDAAAVAKDHQVFAAGLAAFRKRLSALAKDDTTTVGAAVREDFKVTLGELKKTNDAALTRLKDLLAAYRTVRALYRKVDAPAPDTSKAPPVAELMAAVRLRTALAGAEDADPVSSLGATFVMPIMFKALTWLLTLQPVHPPKLSPAQIRQNQLTQLGQLGQLIAEVVAAGPEQLELEGGAAPAFLGGGLRQRLAQQYAALIPFLNDLAGAAIPAALDEPWLPLHAALIAKATTLQLLLDQSAPLAPATPAVAPSLTVGGHMQLAGVADVHVVLNHVINYSKADIAQIENILLGEKRDRRYRTVTRDETHTEKITDTTTTQEKDLKTEDKSDLKSETDQTLKEALGVKAGVDITYKPSDSLTLKVNASVDYSRTKDEANKVASDFAKDITSTAVNKVVTEVKTSLKTSSMLKTEEVVSHNFDNPTSPTASNISGVYRWIEKIFENVHLTVGGPSAIFDGVVLQPAQRILQQPVDPTTALGLAPPPLLTVSPADVAPWNYMSLAATYGATSVPTPPPLYSTTGFSSASASTAPQGVSQDVPLPTDTQAVWATVIWDAQDRKHDKPDHADARASLGGVRLTSTIGADNTDDAAHALQNSFNLLSGQRGSLSFAGLFYDAIGYECTVEIGCGRTPEAYSAWQLSVYAALASARAQAQSTYDDQAARAQLQTSYNYGPSPGDIAAMIKEEIKRCAIGVLATQVAGQNIFDRLAASYTAGDADMVSRLCLIFEHAFAWEDMSYVLYPYFWADPANNGWALHTATTSNDDAWTAFLRAGAARVVVPVQQGFIRASALGIVDPANPLAPSGPNPLQMLQEDVSAILDATLTFDDLLSITSPMTISAAQEAALNAQVLTQWTEVDRWLLRTPTELVMLQDLTDPLPVWQWAPAVDLTKGVANAWIPEP